jgi:hypothetical protein
MHNWQWIKKEKVPFSAAKSKVSDLIFMQFTGLQDKKNTDLYESDIVKYNDPNGNWCKGIVKWSTNDAAWIVDETWLLCEMHYDVLVIGNIHESKKQGK